MFTSQKFKTCLAKTLEFEGGKDDDPYDPGGRTAYGIIQTEYDKWRIKNGLKKQDVWKISQLEKEQIYWENYWVPLQCEDFHIGIAFVLFDFGVNSGNSRSVKYAQKALHLTQDGKIGPKTYNALKNADPVTFINLLDNMRLSYLETLSTWWRFGKGWSDRVKKGRQFGLSLCKNT